MVTPLVHMLQSPDREELLALLAPRARFQSPVADYNDRDDVVHLLTIIPTVLRDVRVERAFREGTEHATFFTGAVGEHCAEAVLRERRSPDGRVEEATLMVRPLSALHAAVRGMRDALAADPLPSQR
jgi:hypothetical protein